MAAEPTDPTLGVSPSWGPWVPGEDPWSQLNNGTGNSTSGADGDQPSLRVHHVLSLVTMLVSLCGAAGNGAVVWLLGFRLKRSPFSVYILNLACADGIFLLCKSVRFMLFFLKAHRAALNTLIRALSLSSYLAGLGLLMAVSTERCVSVLWPLWHRCRRPAHLSCAVCALIWGLGLCLGVLNVLCAPWGASWCDVLHFIYYGMFFLSFLVLCVSVLTLLVRVQCGSRGTRPSRLHVTVLLTVLAFLLLGLPLGASLLAHKLCPSFPKFEVILPVSHLLSALNSAVNPVIYFFVGRYRQRPGRTPLREVLQRALRDGEVLSSGDSLSSRET